MNKIDKPITGAKAMSFYEFNPRALMKEILEKMPDVSWEAGRDELQARLDAEPQYLPAVIDNFYTRERANLLGETKSMRKQKTAQERAEQETETAALTAQLVAKIRGNVLSEMPMSNGKMLKECDEKEVCRDASLHTHKGRFLQRVCKAISGTGALVGEKFSEAELQDMHST
jgi:hypothetical protein